MRIEIRGRNVEMTDDLREMVRKRFQRLGQQVSPLATLEVVLSEERNPSITDSKVEMHAWISVKRRMRHT